MLNYIRAELYKVTHRLYTWIMLGLIFLGEGFMFIIWFDNRPYMTFYEAVSVVAMMMILGFFATLFTCDMVFAEQYKNSTLKNEVSFGLSRSKIYLGKFIAMTILSVLAMVIALGVYIGVCRLMLPDYALNAVYNETLGAYEGGGALTALQLIGLGVLTELPVWLGCQAIICAASFLMNSAIAANAAALGIVLGSHYVIQFVSLFLRADSLAAQLLTNIYSWLPYEPLLTLYPGVAWLQNRPVPAILEIDWAMIHKAWIIGGFWFILATAVGLYFFRKKEIK